MTKAIPFVIYCIVWCVVLSYQIFAGREKERKDEDRVGGIQNRKNMERNHDI